MAGQPSFCSSAHVLPMNECEINVHLCTFAYTQAHCRHTCMHGLPHPCAGTPGSVLMKAVGAKWAEHKASQKQPTHSRARQAGGSLSSRGAAEADTDVLPLPRRLSTELECSVGSGFPVAGAVSKIGPVPESPAHSSVADSRSSSRGTADTFHTSASVSTGSCGGAGATSFRSSTSASSSGVSMVQWPNLK